jgi:PAS domain S-box-containing protein
MIVTDSVKGLKSYATFLLEQRLEEASIEYLAIVRDINVPLLQLFTHLSEEELLAFVKENLANFFSQLKEERFLEVSFDTLEKWKQNQLPGIPRQEVQAADLIFTYTARKRLFTKLLPAFTSDLETGIRILDELDSLFSHVQTRSIETYSDINKQEVLEQKDFAELLISNSTDAIMAYDREEKVTLWNKAMELRTDITAEQAYGKRIYEVYPGLQNPKEATAQQNVWKGTTTQLYAHTDTAEQTFYNIKLVPLSAQGHIIGGVTFIQDITESKLKEINLIEFQEELQAMNEELQESREEYMAANEELTESHESLLNSYVKIQQQYEQLLQLQQELKESGSKYRLLALNASELITAYADDGTYSYVSDSAREIIGVEPASLIGTNPIDLVHPDDVPILYEMGQRLLKENRPQRIEFRLRCKNDEYRWMESFIRFVYDPENPELRQMQASTRDIHERKLAKFALATERNYLSTLLENIADGIVACNAQGQITYSNLSSKALQEARERGISVAEWNEFFKIEYADGTGKMTQKDLPMQRALNGDTIKDYQFLVVTEDGSYRHIICNAQPLLDTNGTITGAISVTRDITGSKEAEKQLQSQHVALVKAYEELQATELALQQANADLEQKVIERTRSLEETHKFVKDRELLLDTVINATPALISYVSRNLTYQVVNKAYLDWFQVREDEIINIPVTTFMDGKVRNHPGTSVLNNALAGKIQKFEIELLHYDGNWRQVEVHYIPHILDNGEIPGFVVLTLDITARLQSKKELEEKNKQLEKINIDLDNFVYTASHDLKAPISNIEGLFAQLNKRLSHTFGDTEKRIFQMAQISIQKFKTTIQYLTEISRIEHETDAHKEELLFRQSIDDVLFDISPLVAEASPKFIFDLEVETITYSPKSLRSVVYNLISNSIKYRSQDRPCQIKIRTYLENGRTVFELQDNGMGMDAQQLSKLFSMFRRFHSHVEGTGVGLFMIKRMIENFGGSIEAQSTPDVGTTFKVTF